MKRLSSPLPKHCQARNLEQVNGARRWHHKAYKTLEDLWEAETEALVGGSASTGSRASIFKRKASIFPFTSKGVGREGDT